MKNSKSFSKAERAMLSIALAGIMLCLYLLLFENGSSRRVDSSHLLGQVVHQANDTRHKQNGSYAWDSARKKQKIYYGDSIYSGTKSEVQVNLLTGTAVQIGENSLVTFEQVDHEKVLALETGNFRLKVDGELKVLIQGQITTLKGQNSDVQVFIDKKSKPKLRLLHGKAELQVKNKTTKLSRKSLASLSKTGLLMTKLPPSALAEIAKEPRSPAEAETDRQQEVVEAATPEPEETLGPQAAVNEIAAALPETPVEIPFESTPLEVPKPAPLADLNYSWKLHDLYEQRELEVLEKSSRPNQVPLRQKLRWSLQTLRPVHVELSAHRDFQNKSTFDSATGELTLSRVSLGENYWRVSTDGVHWSDPQMFYVQAGFAKSAQAPTTLNKVNLEFKAPTLAYTLPLQVSSPVLGVIAQASKTPDFQKSETKTFWSSKTDLNLSFYHPGVYFYRFRSVSLNQELSEWSKPTRFQITEPKKPVLELKLAKVAKKKPEPPIAKTEVPKPIIERKVEVKQVADVPRAPAATPSQAMTLKIETDPAGTTNQKYKNSRLSAEGLLWTLQSSDQRFEKSTAPVSTGVGIHGTYWKDHHGFEGSFKTGAVAMNDTGQQSAGGSLKDVEARYHYRFYTGFPFGLAKELQMSVFTGVESYRNSASYFSSEYDLMKFGTSLEFPWARKWSSGGEFVYGAGADMSKKMEISGKFNYFLSPSWSVGAGYRVHFFEAGSKKTAPSGYMPYREGYTEGFSVLNYHF